MTTVCTDKNLVLQIKSAVGGFNQLEAQLAATFCPLGSLVAQATLTDKKIAKTPWNFRYAYELGGWFRRIGAMAGIARNVELYNLAYKFAWKYISEDQKREQPNIAGRLHDFIRRRLKEGATDAVFIASEALEDVERS